MANKLSALRANKVNFPNQAFAGEEKLAAALRSVQDGGEFRLSQTYSYTSDGVGPLGKSLAIVAPNGLFVCTPDDIK